MDDAPPLTEGVLFTDQYQLTMAQLYFRHGLAGRDAQFDYFHRTNPDYGTHQAGYCITAGLGGLLDWMSEARFGPAELDALAAQRGASGARRFDDGFLAWLSEHGHFRDLRVAAVPEGRVVHPHLPVLTVQGPLAMAQILETSLLNHMNYPTLVATKASRIADSARGSAVLEFGMRRGPGWGVNSAARAALIGGCNFTSNVGMSHELGLDPKGTHAHSLVQVFIALRGGELEAFRAYAEAYPDECVLLVDTIDTLGSGVPNALTVFAELRAAGHEPRGIRLDSGDLAFLSIQAARALDAAGFPDVSIVLSNDLDELAIWQILSQIDQEAPRYGVDAAALRARLTYGVGTNLITSAGHAALDGVYKLVAVRSADGSGTPWTPAIKLSENPVKIPIPGEKSIWRLYDARGMATVDVVAGVDEDPLAADPLVLHHPYRPGVRRVLRRDDIAEAERLAALVYSPGSGRATDPLAVMRDRRRADLDRLDPGVRRLVNPHVYHVSLTTEVKANQQRLIDEVTGIDRPPAAGGA
ncbi:MAG: nicotinate phosphoribosyltransferase, partial [Acidimicrobiia bacterium]|nr:nicotinate phosphoribosyltransferase [Acidimicrobiia bacterium]